MEGKKIILGRVIAHIGLVGPGNFFIYWLFVKLLGEAGHSAMFLFLAALVALLTWFDAVWLYEWPPHWLREARLKVYVYLYRQHERNTFSAATHFIWGLWLVWGLLWVTVPHNYQFSCYMMLSLIAALADSVASAVGSYFSYRNWNLDLSPASVRKSVAGSIAFLVAAWLVVWMSARYLPESPKFTWAEILLIAQATTVGELFGDVVSWRSVRLDDNFLILILGFLAVWLAV